MRLRRVGWAGAMALLLGASGLGAAPAAPAWLHVRVEEPGRQSKVAVNLPLSVVEAALEAAPSTIVSAGRVKLGPHHRELKIAELRRMWNELKSAGDGEFATVEEKDEKVRIARTGDLVLIHVQKPPDRDAVRVELPVAVVDALLSGEGDQLDVGAALAQLRNRRGDIVRVDDEGSTVRIWIDEGR